MRYVLVALLLGACGGISAQAFGEELQAFRNFDAKIAALESYSIQHVDAGKAPPPKKIRVQGDGLKVKLIRSKKKG